MDSDQWQCSFKDNLKTACGSSRGCSQSIKLTECNDNIEQHLKSCNLWKTSGLNETYLILARAGHFELSINQINSMSICPRHRHILGKFWRPPGTCRYPLHTGPRKKHGKDYHIINVAIAKDIQAILKKTVAIGSPICRTCRDKHRDLLERNGSWLREQREQSPGDTFVAQTRYRRLVVAEGPGVDVSSSPAIVPETPCAAGDIWTPGCLSNIGSDSFVENLREAFTPDDSAVDSFNEAMAKIAEHTTGPPPQPLNIQMSARWDDATEGEKDNCISKAEEACRTVCSVIAPNDGERLFNEMAKTVSNNTNGPTDDLIALMSAYRNAQTKNVKLQILSIYAYRHTMKKLQEFHEPYEKVSLRQIKMARAHAKMQGPGSIVPKVVNHRVRLDTSKVEHFVDFINRPYFYQDVAFGTRTLTLEDGRQITMPNIVRTITRSTMIKQYLEHCKEDSFQPISRSTMYRILEVREASQQKSLSGLDNTAADGVCAYARLTKILDELHEIGADKETIDRMKKRLSTGKNYLKTSYKHDCAPEESECADHCRRFSLSDSSAPELQAQCSHKSHSLFCNKCEDIKALLDEIEVLIRTHSNRLYGDEQRDDLLYDFHDSKNKIVAWKCHIIRGVNQECAKQEVLLKLDQDSALIVIDWAMKFLQMRYRERQSDWFAKRGLSWHISSVITRDSLGKTRVLSYAHLFDSCSQDWYAVTSILENLLQNIKVDFPNVQKVFFRSDEAGCYHTSNLIAAVRDLGKRVGINVERYDFSEPQQGKDICDRVLCPMKAAIRKYCNEGHDILNVSDMRKALRGRPVKGTTVAACTLDINSQNLAVQKIVNFGQLHNFQCEENGLRTWKAYGIGKGEFISWDSLYIKHQGPTNISVLEGEEFFKPCEVRELPFNKHKEKVSRDDEDDQPSLFVCSEDGCNCTFNFFSELELHVEAGIHESGQTKKRCETLYDTLKLEWAAKFSTIDTYQTKQSQNESNLVRQTSTQRTSLNMGWALAPPRTGGARFSNNVRQYLTAKFELGEKTGRKADPEQVSHEMRSARNEKNERRFERKEWLSKTQIKGFFSRLAKKKRSSQDDPNYQEEEEDPVAIMDDVEQEIRESERCSLIEEIGEAIGLQHPIVYDTFNLCQYFQEGKIGNFNVKMLKTMLSFFEIPYRAKQVKAELVGLLCGVIKECKCNL